MVGRSRSAEFRPRTRASTLEANSSVTTGEPHRSGPGGLRSAAPVAAASGKARPRGASAAICGVGGTHGQATLQHQCAFGASPPVPRPTANPAGPPANNMSYYGNRRGRPVSLCCSGPT